MNFNEYQIEAGKTAIYPNRSSNLVYTVLGLCGEVGEAAEKLEYLIVEAYDQFDEDEQLVLVDLHNALMDMIDSARQAERLKKVIRDGNRSDTTVLVQAISKLNSCITPTFHDAMSRELGDVLWYLSQAAWEIGVKFADLAKWNLNKLAIRKEQDSLHGSGDDR